MKLPLWSKVLGVLLGLMVGATTAYAAVTVYQYKEEIPGKAKITDDVVASPGMTLSSSSLDFGTIGVNGCSDEVYISLKNKGNKDISLLHRYVVGLPQDVDLEVSYDSTNWNDFEGYVSADPNDGVFEAGETIGLYLRLSASENTKADSLNFTIGFEEAEQQTITSEEEE
ncbi:MAG: hypothetical protein ACLFVK_02330 [Dehalococcoidia bacterium]